MKRVIERIVESSGAPNENDLWLNGTTLKKFQNGEWIPVGGSMGESEEYTIAQALNDLNERIDGLQSQVSQQDYLRIEIADPDNPTAEEKAKILDAHNRGVLMNVLLVLQFDVLARVLTDAIDSNASIQYVTDSGELKNILCD